MLHYGPHLAVLAVHVGVADAELLPGLAHPEALPEGHEDGPDTCGGQGQIIDQLHLLYCYADVKYTLCYSYIVTKKVKHGCNHSGGDVAFHQFSDYFVQFNLSRSL